MLRSFRVLGIMMGACFVDKLVDSTTIPLSSSLDTISPLPSLQ